MQSEPIISVSGLRGIIGSQLTPPVAMRYVSALATTLPSGVVIVSRDGRESGSVFAQVVFSTLAAHGLTPVDLGIAATPTVGVEVRERSAVGGIQISASHNPKEYNGLKLFGADGRVLPKSKGEAVLAAYHASRAEWVGVDQLGSYQVADHPHRKHCELVLQTVNAENIRRNSFRVLLDSNHGAGSLLGRQLLESLGCQVTQLGETPDGRFSHSPEPTSENLTGVAALLSEGGFDVGFCQDPDADRLAIIDETGAYIGEEMTLALCLKHVLNQRTGTVITNCATSSLAKILAEKHGCRLLQSAVGEANVADLMIAENAIFGGEGNGGPIDPRVGYVRDSFVGMANVLELLAASQMPVSQHVAELPPLSIHKDKCQLDDSTLPRLLDALTQRFSEASPSRPDGLKLDWEDRWLLVRGSNTEPIVRFIAEAPSMHEAKELCVQAKQIAEELRS
jgi:phosphomannomutase